MAARRTQTKSSGSGGSGGPVAAAPTSRHIRAGLGDPALAEVVAWTDEAYALATEIIDRGEAAHELDAASLHGAYRAMLQMRALDKAAQQLAGDGTIGSYVVTSGVEAAVAGAMAALAPDDMVVAHRRSGAAALVRGLPVTALAAQLFGNAHDLARGRRLPGCPALPRALNVVPGSSHAGTQLPHAAGIAWAAKMQRKPTVALAYLDPQEVDAEDFHAGVNFAGAFHLPVIFVCLSDRLHSP